MENINFDPKKLGYARVSTDKQNIANQKRVLLREGVLPENIFSDVNISGTVSAKKRKGFDQVYQKIKNGDVDSLCVVELSRLGRSSNESIQLFIEIEQMGCKILSLAPNEAWTRVTDVPGIRNIFVSMFAWFADLERQNISERTKIGLARAKAQGKMLGRPKRPPDRKTYNKIISANPNLKPAQVAMIMKVPTTTFYRYLKKWQEEERIAENKRILEAEQ